LLTPKGLDQKESEVAKNKPMPLAEALQVILAADGDNPLRAMI
jgi:hypothetical protein